MFVRPTYVWKNGQRHAYWRLVESYRTERGPRQRTVAYLGQMDEAGRLGVRDAVESGSPSSQRRLFAESETEPRYVEIDHTQVRVENCRQFGGPWLALELIKKLGLDEFLKRAAAGGAGAGSLVADGVDSGDRPLVRALQRALHRRALLPAKLRWATCWACRSTRWTTTVCIAASTRCCHTNRRWRHFSRSASASCLPSSTTCSCMTSPARTSRARRTRIPWPSVATRATIAPTASRCASAWW